ncbi:MAG TPA: hypothetical protein VGJ84_16455, partial [Polyangiaceae bacterium]
SEPEVWGEVAGLVREAALSYAELIAHNGSGPRVVYQEPVKSGPMLRELVVSEYSLGRGNSKSTLRFGWQSETGDVPPHMDILLQLVADRVTEALTVLSSDLVMAAEVPAQTSGAKVPVPGGI